jgi:hypothetical protein
VIYEEDKKNDNIIIYNKVLDGLQKSFNSYSENCGYCFYSVDWHDFNKIYSDNEPYQKIILEKYHIYCNDPLNKTHRTLPKDELCYFAIAIVVPNEDDNKIFYVKIKIHNLAHNTSQELGEFKISRLTKVNHETEQKYINTISDSILLLFKKKDLINKFFKFNKPDSVRLYMAHMDSVYNLLEEYIAAEIYQDASDNRKFHILRERIEQDNHFYQKYFEKKLNFLINLYDNAENSEKKREYTNEILKFMSAHFMVEAEMTIDVSRHNKRLNPALQMIGEHFLTLQSKYKVNSESNLFKKKKPRQQLIEEFLNKVRNKEESAKPKSSASTLESNNNK